MSVEERGGVFRARVRRRGLSLSASFPSEAEAEAWRAAAIVEIENDRTPTMPERPTLSAPITPLTVEGACREWIAGAESGVVRTPKGRPYREGTLYTTEDRLRLHVLPYIGAMPVATLTPGVIRRWLEELQVETTATVAHTTLGAFRPVMRRLVELEVIPADPSRDVRAPAYDPKPIRFLDPQEGARLRAAAYADHYPGVGAFVDLGLATGARRGELLGITWGPGGLDLEERTATIAGSWSPRTKDTGPTKSGKTRTIPLGAEVTARMREYRMAAGRPPDGSRLFTAYPDRPWKRIRERAAWPIPSRRFTRCRHTAATWWLAAGLTVHAVAELLGHADASMVIKLYGHALPAEKSTAGDRLEAFLEGSSGVE